MTTRGPVKLSDPKAIRALAHPARLAVIEELYAGRELTATECAEIAGMSPSAMSYHLRSLQKWGVVEPAESTGDGRERPWRAAGNSLQVTTDSDVAEAAMLGTTVLGRLNEQFAAWLARRAEEPKWWRDAARVSSGHVWVTAEELETVGRSIEELLDHYRDRNADARPDGARRVRFGVLAFPSEAPPARQ
ncbi:MAG: ArsR/SmtB family transcription factor [Jatrophihabitantaceae bacterium]